MSKDQVLYQLLSEIERNPSVSQKDLSREVGISVGMVNWHVKRFVSKGLVKLQEAPLKRYLYYLTPEGFSEKAKLTADFLHTSFDVFRQGREQYSALFDLCSVNGWCNIVLLGNTELTELAVLVANQFPKINLVAVMDGDAERSSPHGVNLASRPEEAVALAVNLKVDVVISCQFNSALLQGAEIEEVLTGLNIDRSRFLMPGILQ
ncbi:winged helix-turn-helix transcriptional regulator [uncultured Kiloniella sp.]|uniref:winged helix-turn-helix transcriptional regulator n=1 Tax=uncultured Kiloniella sp. TaxID=1133091 RepID=UPI002618D71B|nr:winged helix-turn-helix transcriptional regulator [uncultured Kiloniella sp.]